MWFLGLNLLTLCFRGCWVIKSPVTTALCGFTMVQWWWYHGTKGCESGNLSRTCPGLNMKKRKQNVALFFADLIILGWGMTLRCGIPVFPFCTVETWWHAHVLRNVVPGSTSQTTAEQECQWLLIDVIVLCFLSQWLPVQTPADRRLGRWEILPAAAFRCKLWDTAHTHTRVR